MTRSTLSALLLSLVSVVTFAQEPSPFDRFYAAYLSGELRLKPGTPKGTPGPSAINVPADVTLSWLAFGARTSDVYLSPYKGTSCTPVKVAADIPDNIYAAKLAPNTAHCWKIVAKNGAGTITSPTWKFTTADMATPRIDCVPSAWTMQQPPPDWSACQPNGTQTRTETWTRTVMTPPSGGGAECDLTPEMRPVSQDCTPPPPLPLPVPPSVPVLLPASRLAWNYTDADFAAGQVSHFELATTTGGPWSSVGIPSQQTPFTGGWTYAIPAPTLPVGTYAVRVRACRAAECGAASDPLAFKVVATLPPNGGSLVAQGLHPRTAGLSTARIPAIAAKLNASYDDDPTLVVTDVKGSFPAFISALDVSFGQPATQANGLAWAPAYCEAAHLLPALSTGGTTGIRPQRSAAEYGAEGARLARGITSLAGLDGGFPQANAAAAYDWCHKWLTPTERGSIRAALRDTEAGCDALYVSYWSADSHKNCSAMFTAAVAVAGDDGETWGTAKLTEWDAIMASLQTGIIGSESAVANLYRSESGYGSCSTPGLAYHSYMWQYDLLAAETYRFGATTLTPAEFYDAKYSYLASGVYCLAYLTRPYARTSVGTGNPHDLEWLLSRTQYTATDQVRPNDASELPLSIFAGIWPEPEPASLAQWYQRHRMPTSDVSGPSRIGRQWAYRFVLDDPMVAERGPIALKLPLSARMGDGSNWFRGAWDGDAATNTNWVVKISLPAFSAPGDGREVMTMHGAIEVRRKGDQLIWRGAGAHVPQCHGCANTLYFFNPLRKTPWTTGDERNAAHDGRPLSGASQPHASNRGADIVSGGPKDYTAGDTFIRKRFASGAGTIDYLYADRRRAYPHASWWTTAQSPAVQSEVIEQYVIFRPTSQTGPVRIARFSITTPMNNHIPLMAWNPSTDAITVDGTTSPGALHSLNPHGFQKSTNSRVLTASNAYNFGGFTTSGRNTLTVVHPSPTTVVIAGGPDEKGGSCTYADGDKGWDSVDSPGSATSLENVDYYGFRWPHLGSGACADPMRRATQGRFFATVSPSSAPSGVRVKFVLFYETGDAGSVPATIAELMGLTNFEGLAWRGSDANGIAIIGANAADQTSGAFTVPLAGTYTAVLSNLSDVASRTVTFTAGCGTMTNRADDVSSKTIEATITTTQPGCTVTVK